MGILSKESLLGASDLIEKEVELPGIGGSVKVRSLPAGYSNQAMSEALEVITTPQGQKAHVNTAKLEQLQVLHGLVEPKLASVQEAERLSQQLGSAWRKIVQTIDEISGIDKESIEKAEATFPAGGSRETANGDGPDPVVAPVAAGEGSS